MAPLGETIAEIRVTGPKGSKAVRAVVDTGATNTVIDEDLARELGIVVLADGSVDKVGVGSAQIEIQGVTRIVPVYIYKETLVGLTTLEAAGLRVNPVSEMLEKVRGELL